MKTITLFTCILIMALFSFNALAESSHLDQAIEHAESAAKSADGKGQTFSIGEINAVEK